MRGAPRTSIPPIAEATHDYESWVAARATLVPEDLEAKHRHMAEDAFSFLRATFYRWSQRWAAESGDLSTAPSVLGVGDLHIENFGTWRDGEGRLVWGVNDFDEAAEMPYTADLVRLATSALLARQANKLALSDADCCAALLDGYRHQLDKGGEPFILEEGHASLRALALNVLRDPDKFWKRLEALPAPASPVPAEIRARLDLRFPESGLDMTLKRRVAGLGSLGRERYLGLALWKGGRIAREIKFLVPSGWGWARGEILPLRYLDILGGAIRCPDPWLSLDGNWIVRRLSPHCGRVELTSLTEAGDESVILKAMGRETANVHLGTTGAANAIKADLDRRGPEWLRRAATQMLAATMADWTAWKAL